MTTDERRHFSRIFFTAEVKLQCGDNEFTCRLLDISLKGALLDIENQPSSFQSEVCRLIVPLGEDEEIVMKGGIVHMEENHLGMRCSEVDLESMTNLRRLVELNLGDSAMLDRELTELLHFSA